MLQARDPFPCREGILKYLGFSLSAVIFAFWGLMNYFVVLRQHEMESLGRFRAGVTNYLGSSLYRERWLGIYKKQRKVGYTGWTFEKVFAEEGVEIQSNVESKIEIELLGQSRFVGVEGTLVLDGEMRPLRLQLDMDIDEEASLTLDGRQQGRNFLVTLKRGEKKMLQLPLPIEELCLGNGLIPTLPVAGFKVGETYHVSCFDPTTMSRDIVAVRVVSREVREIDRLQVDAFELETSYRGFKSRSWVTEAGEILRQEFGPPFEDYVLRRETKENARRFIKK